MYKGSWVCSISPVTKFTHLAGLLKKKLNYVLRCTGKLNKEEKSFLESKKISNKVEVFNNISV